MPVSETVLTKQQKIAKLARNAPDMSFMSLNHYLTLEWLEEAFRLTRKDGAVGVDKQTGEDYAVNLQTNLKDLLERAKSGRYFAPPVRRTYIPKDSKSGQMRPLGIPTFEEKILQKAICMIIEPIYEQDFLPSSFGFRPRRSAHDCIKEIRETLHIWGGGYIIDADIKGYFDSIDKSKLRAILDDRVRDGVIRRLIGKWLKAGVKEKDQISIPETGVMQGGVISPLMSNIYLHTVLDKWFEEQVMPRLGSSAKLYRFADDFLIICQSKSDADRIMDALPKRFDRFGLTIHPEKTKQLDFNRPQANVGKPALFDFLGFTFHWGKTRRGQHTVKLKTRKERFKRSLRKIHELCRAMRHEPLIEQQMKLNRVLIGTYNYYGVTFNHRYMKMLRWKAYKAWQYWLNRRSQRRDMPWERFEQIVRKHFPIAQARVKVALF